MKFMYDFESGDIDFDPEGMNSTVAGSGIDSSLRPGELILILAGLI